MVHPLFLRKIVPKYKDFAGEWQRIQSSFVVSVDVKSFLLYQCNKAKKLQAVAKLARFIQLKVWKIKISLALVLGMKI